jgi:hypothetical protein
MFIDDLTLVMAESDIDVLRAGFARIRETCAGLAQK